MSEMPRRTRRQKLQHALDYAEMAAMLLSELIADEQRAGEPPTMAELANRRSQVAPPEMWRKDPLEDLFSRRAIRSDGRKPPRPTSGGDQ